MRASSVTEQMCHFGQVLTHSGPLTDSRSQVLSLKNKNMQLHKRWYSGYIE